MKRRLFTSNTGFTLIELMAVVIIIIILVALMVFGASYANRKAATEQTAAEIKTLQSALETYKNDNGTYPTCASGNNLGVLLGKYLTSWPTTRITGNTLLKDPFFIDYQYRYPGTINTTNNLAPGASGGYDLWSCGPNRNNDNGDYDDIASWNR